MHIIIGIIVVVVTLSLLGGLWESVWDFLSAGILGKITGVTWVIALLALIVSKLTKNSIFQTIAIWCFVIGLGMIAVRWIIEIIRH